MLLCFRTLLLLLLLLLLWSWRWFGAEYSWVLWGLRLFPSCVLIVDVEVLNVTPSEGQELVYLIAPWDLTIRQGAKGRARGY